MSSIRLAAAGLVLWTLPLVAFAESHVTSAFKIDTPPRWSLREIQKGAAGTGTWMLSSPSKDSRVLVHIGTDRGGPLDAQFERFVEHHLRARVRKLEITSYRAYPADEGLESAFATFYGVARRVANGHVYKLGTYAMRAPGGKRTAFLTLLGTKHAWGRQALRFGKLIDSFELQEGGAK